MRIEVWTDKLVCEIKSASRGQFDAITAVLSNLNYSGCGVYLMDEDKEIDSVIF